MDEKDEDIDEDTDDFVNKYIINCKQGSEEESDSSSYSSSSSSSSNSSGSSGSSSSSTSRNSDEDSERSDDEDTERSDDEDDEDEDTGKETDEDSVDLTAILKKKGQDIIDLSISEHSAIETMNEPGDIIPTDDISRRNLSAAFNEEAHDLPDYSPSTVDGVTYRHYKTPAAALAAAASANSGLNATDLPTVNIEIAPLIRTDPAIVSQLPEESFDQSFRTADMSQETISLTNMSLGIDIGNDTNTVMEANDESFEDEEGKQKKKKKKKKKKMKKTKEGSHSSRRSRNQGGCIPIGGGSASVTGRGRGRGDRNIDIQFLEYHAKHCMYSHNLNQREVITATNLMEVGEVSI